LGFIKFELVYALKRIIKIKYFIVNLGV